QAKGIELFKLPREHFDAVFKSARASVEAVKLPEPKPADWSGVKQIAAATGSVRWLVLADPGPEPETRLGPRAVPVLTKDDEIQRVLFTPPDVGQAAIVSAVVPNKLSSQKVFRLDRYDLAGGQHLGTMNLCLASEDPFAHVHERVLPVAFSPEG